MYGLEDIDLVVRYYDDAFGISGEAELAWYLDKVRKSGDPILDLAAGTGRLALAFARDGFQVTGIDRSKGMLDIFKRKRKQEDPEIRHKIDIKNQEMTNFHLYKKFNAVVCCDAFFHNLTVEDQINCLLRVAQHLKPGGHFLFNLPNPNCQFLMEVMNSDPDQFEERGRYTLQNNQGTLLVEQSNSVDLLSQIITTKLRFTRFNGKGYVDESGESHWKSRYLFRYEAIHLLYRCGFKVKDLVGDYKNGPVTVGGQLIFDVTL